MMRLKVNDQLIANLALLSIVSVFVPLLLRGVETQAVVGVFLIFIMRKNIYKILLRQQTGEVASIVYIYMVFLVVCAIFSSVLLNSFSSYGALLKFMLPVVFFCVIYNRKLSPSNGFVMFLVLLHWFLFVLFFVGITQPFDLIFQRFSVGDSVRGYSYMASEPSYAATYLICLLYATYLFYSNEKYYVFCVLSIVFFVLTTKSILGILFLLVYLVLLLRMRTIVLIFISMLVSGSLIISYILSQDGDSRIISFMRILITIDYSNLISSLVILEPSGMNRILVNFIGIGLGFSNLIGYGLGSFESMFGHVARLNGFEILQEHELLKYAYLYSAPVPPQSYFSALAFESGIFSLIYMVMIFFFVGRIKSKRNRVFIGLMVCIFSFFQSQVSNPALFYLIALGFSSNLVKDTA